MNKHALVIGSQTEGLRGVENDAERMTTYLQGRGFRVDLRVKKKAGLDGIREGYEELIDRTGPDDAAVVYYSGHGCLSENSNYSPMGTTRTSLPDRVQFIVPYDMPVEPTDEFRGISDLELSILLARLTGRTRNVAVIFDCCHANGISRDRQENVKSLSRSWPWVPVEKHLREYRAAEKIVQTYPEGNPYAVRIVACQAEQRAYEYRRPDGTYAGQLTHALLETLREAGIFP